MTKTRAAWCAVVLLGLLYVVSYVDRLVLTLLVDPLRAEFGIDDVSMGLLIGLAFALFYAAVGVPLGLAADRGNRRLLVLAGVLTWSTSTLLSAFAPNFEVLALLRAGVAVGEAVLTPCALSMISDLFSREKRAGATSFYVFCGTLGAFGGFALGGLVVAFVGEAGAQPFGLDSWRLVLLVVGIPGFVLAMLFALFVREPPRTAPAPAQSERGDLLIYLRKHWAMLGAIFVGSSLGQMMLLGVTAWAPTYLVRSHNWAISDAGVWLGVCGIIASLIGLAVIPRFANSWTQAGRRDALPIVAVGTVLIPLPLVLGATQMPNGEGFLALSALAFIPLVCSGTLAMIAIQWIAPPRMQAVLVAILFLINSLLALGLGPLLVSAIAQHHWLGAQDLGAAFTRVALFAAPLGALLLWMSRDAFAEALSGARRESGEH